jgi:hypothetical protein
MTLIVVLCLAALAVAGPVRFAVIGDRTGGHQDGIHEKIVAEVAAAKPEFVITVGDHIEGYQQSDTLKLEQEWQEYKAIVAPLKVPTQSRTWGPGPILTHPPVAVWLSKSFSINRDIIHLNCWF